MRLTDAQIVRAMELLGLQQGDFRAIETAPSFEVGVQRLEELKARVKKQFRRAALELHPDRTNNDPAKTEDFKLVSAAVDEIDRLTLRRPPPPRPRVHYIRVHFGYGGTASTTTSTTSYWNGFGF